jgi:hypothetical protein
VAGAAARAHDAALAERLAVAALRALDAPTAASQLFGKGKWVGETAEVAALIRKQTEMVVPSPNHSTVTLLARFRGWSISQPRRRAT